MQVQHTVYLLKVLSGANSGAIVRLKTGGLIIGRSMVCDIILHDENIADEHVRIEINDDAIKLQPIALPVYIDGEEIGMRQVELQPYQVVTLGDVDFLIADPRISESEARVVSARGEKDYIAGGVSGSSGKTDRSKKKDSRNSSLSNKSYLWLGLLLLLLGNLLFFAPNLLKLSEKIGLKSTAVDQVQEVIKSLNNKTFDVKTASTGLVTVSGYVKTPAERNEVVGRLMRVGNKVTYRVWVEDELAQNAEMIAHTLGEKSLHFKSIDQGRIAANGYVSTLQDWDRVKNSIMSDIAGVTSIDDTELQTLLKRMEALQQFIEKNDLSSRIRVSIDKGNIKVNGELTKTELDHWKDVYSEFIANYGEGPAIIEELYDARERIKLSIRSVSVGEVPFLVSKDGKKYLEGSNLGNNYFIKAIRPDYVLLVNNGIEIPIYYGLEEK